MSIKKPLILILVIVSNIINAQQSLNGYKYIIVPKQFDFQKTQDKYQLNSLTKFLFAKEGFQTVFDNDVRPQDLAQNQCLALTSKVINKSNMFTTKLVIELLNCRNQIVFTSSEGKSKEKDYKKGYQEAIRNAFESIKELNYSFESSQSLQITEREAIKEEDKSAEIVKEKVPVKTEKETPLVTEIEEATPEKLKETVDVVNDLEDAKVVEPVVSAPNLLYAQENTLGFQLVDSTPKVIYILQKSSIEDVFILKNKNGIVFKKGNKWVTEYYDKGELIQKELNIKF